MDAAQAQVLAKYLANLWEGEFPMTCKVLEAVPNDRRSYKPDPKSRTGWELAVHLAAGDIWFLDAILAGSFSWDPDVENRFRASHQTVSQVVDYYKVEFPKKLNAVRALPAADLSKVVDFFGMFQKPNVTFLGLANNHSMHHRGQLAAYLRAMGSKVPPIYGGSADFPMQGS